MRRSVTWVILIGFAGVAGPVLAAQVSEVRYSVGDLGDLPGGRVSISA